MTSFCENTQRLLSSDPKTDFTFAIERSLYSNMRIFVRAMKDENKISELDSLLLLQKGDRFFDLTRRMFSIVPVFIHLNDDPYFIYQRLRERERPSEESLNLNYILDLQRRYEELFRDPNFPFPVVEVQLGDYVIEGSENREIDVNKIVNVIKDVL